MVGRTQDRSVSENDNGSTISELFDSFKSDFQMGAFTRAQEVLLRREEKLRKEINRKNERNKLLEEKLHVEVLEKLKLQKECAELASQLKEEQNRLLKKLAENADDKKMIFELKKMNCELKCAKLNADTEADIWYGRLKVLEEKISIFEKNSEMLNKIKKTGEAVNMGIEKDASVNLPPVSKAVKKKVSQYDKKRLKTNPKPSGSSSHRKMLVAGNRRPLSKQIVEITDSDDEAALCEDSREIVTEGHVEKADSEKNIAENDTAVHKRALASSLDVNDSCPIGKSKRLKIQEHAPFDSPIEHHSPAALNLGTNNSEKVYTSLELSKILSELGGDSSSSSSSDDDDLDLSLDYSTFIRTDDAAYETRD